MGAAFFPCLIFTAFWGFVGVVLPILVPKGPNREIIRVVLMLTAATCWGFWVCCYMAQMNPLIGPKMTNNTILMVMREWGDAVPT
ncbi:V-type proton ATPase subunit e 2-like [Chrysoperla carnea]|uniref:V-type proton ATPase subunit e 2-like n=1 Tax=Chrysoperla carnea TaxID=189513 RepID=UPI001D09619A|nr:V-type proton ATPase subunit e 2-like [Chrysoperla carnea]